MKEFIQQLFSHFEEIRYVAIYQGKTLTKCQRSTNLLGASAEDSDKYEELLVNPTLLKLATQRGEIDCGGLEYLIIAYGNFTQIIKSLADGHISICLEKTADLNKLPPEIFQFSVSLLKKRKTHQK